LLRVYVRGDDKTPRDNAANSPIYLDLTKSFWIEKRRTAVKEQRFFPGSRHRHDNGIPFITSSALYALLASCNLSRISDFNLHARLTTHRTRAIYKSAPIFFISSECYARVAQLALIYVAGRKQEIARGNATAAKNQILLAPIRNR
jgi:hypothetical protein